MKDAIAKETLAGGMQKHVGPANAAALLTTTVAGFMVTVAGDLLGPSLPTYAFGVLAVVWVLVILVAVALIGRDAAGAAGSTDSAGIVASLRLGFARAMVEKRYALILLLMSFCAVYAAWAQHRQKATVEKISGGMETLQLIAGGTAQGVDAVRKDLASDEVTLLKMGYGPSDEQAWRAFSEGNVPAMEIMRRLNRQQFPATLLDKPSALENLILNPNADVAGALAIAQVSKAELDRPRHIESSYTGAFKVPRRKGIFESVGFTAVRVLPDGGRQRGALYMLYNDSVPWMAEVSPMLLAVWANNGPAVKALLENGASPDGGTLLTTSVFTNEVAGLRTYDVTVTALSEARRLGLRDIVSLLVDAGAKDLSKAERLK